MSTREPVTQEQMLEVIRKAALFPAQLAKELVSVQPMDPFIGKDLIAAATSMTEEELIAAGYRPVEKHGLSLMWVKD